MSGQAFQCDNLQVGDTCIIVADSVNTPTGTWWGTVTEVSGARFPTSTERPVRAIITGGEFRVDPFERPILSDEHKGREPTVNYRVYRDNATTRRLFWKIAQADKRLERATASARSWKALHQDTMAHIAGLADAPKEGPS